MLTTCCETSYPPPFLFFDHYQSQSQNLSPFTCTKHTSCYVQYLLFFSFNLLETCNYQLPAHKSNNPSVAAHKENKILHLSKSTILPFLSPLQLLTPTQPQMQPTTQLSISLLALLNHTDHWKCWYTAQNYDRNAY